MHHEAETDQQYQLNLNSYAFHTVQIYVYVYINKYKQIIYINTVNCEIPGNVICLLSRVTLQVFYKALS